MLEICRQCPLYQHYGGLSHYVRPTTNLHSRYLLIGEGPGQQEVEYGSPFVGPAGQEQNQYLYNANLSRDLFHIRNIVQCRPPGNRDPKPDEIECCSTFLLSYLKENRPEIIAAVGRFAARWFLGEDLSMEYSHGIPVRCCIAEYDTIVIPIYHPAAGMKSTTLMELIRRDYEALGKTIRREIQPRPVLDGTPTIVNALDFAHFPKEMPSVVAIDTETLPDGSPWCLTYCLDDDIHRGRIIMAGNHDDLEKLNHVVNRPYVITVLHNALFDLAVLAKMGVYPRESHDTMVMAYLLQDLPLGLKPLSYRLVDMTLRKYKDVIHDASQQRALEYILAVIGHDWPDPDHVLVWDKGYPRVKKPQNILKKVNKILKKYSEDPTLNLTDKWAAIDYDGGRGQVESNIGPMPEASLADVEWPTALQYACSDAVATYLVYPILRDRISESGLWDTFLRDMRIIPVLQDMMHTGILLDKDYLHRLDLEFESKKEPIEAQINDLYPGSEHLNPGSTQQVAKALYSMRVYPKPTLSTDVKTLDLYRDRHPIIPLISRWRELHKLQSTYTKPMPQKTDENDRVHSKFSNTGTTTGRLSSSKPNLQNIPTKTDEGKAIRHAFVVPPECSLVSLDYSQIEMRCIAHMSEDPTMIRMFMEDLDIHSETAARMFKIPIDQVDKDKHRRPAKNIGFGVAYGMGPMRLQSMMLEQGVEYTERECQDLITAWYGVYPGIYEFMDRIKSEARRYGVVRDYYGRYRLVPEVYSSFQRIVEAGLRQAGNFPIQSMAQQIIKQAMGDLIPIYTELQEGGRYRCHMLLQIHDELVWEISDEIIEIAVPVIQSTMESAVELVIPTPVDHNVGHTWGELK